MIIDHFLEFTKSTGQTLTGNAASEYRFDFYQDEPTTGMDYDRPVAVFTVIGDVTGTLTISLQDCATEEGTYANVAVAAAVSAPAAGTQIVIPIPAHHKRYLQAYFSGATAGVVRGVVTSGIQDNDGFAQAPSLGKNY